MLALSVTACPQPTLQPPMKTDAKVIFLHHSTGQNVWDGGVANEIALWNTNGGTSYSVTEFAYPNSPWPWDNYPSDYYRLWVGGEGSATDANIMPLDALCSQYDVVIWKHCYPVANIGADSGSADPDSSVKTLENYKAAYIALKNKMRTFTEKRFIVWTGAARLSANCTQEEAQRLRDFHTWIINNWDEDGDNIYVFDFWMLETEGDGLYLNPTYAVDAGNDHPNPSFCAVVAPKFAERIIDVLQGRGDTDPATGR